jgi:hypothetical protein
MKSVVHVAAKTCLTHSTRLACRFSAWEHLAAEITAFSMGLTHQQACLTKKAHNTHTHTHKYTHIHTRTRLHICTHTCANTQKHTHTHEYTHTRTHTGSSSCGPNSATTTTGPGSVLSAMHTHTHTHTHRLQLLWLKRCHHHNGPWLHPIRNAHTHTHTQVHAFTHTHTQAPALVAQTVPPPQRALAPSYPQCTSAACAHLPRQTPPSAA